MSETTEKGEGDDPLLQEEEEDGGQPVADRFQDCTGSKESPTTTVKGSYFRMVLAGVMVNLPGLSIGLSHGFSAILIPELQKPDSSISITLEEGSWIASLFVIGDLIGCALGGIIADRWGRRFALCVDCIPLALGWLLSWQSTSLLHILMARAVTGLGIGANLPTSIYLREISTPEMRGSLSVLMPLAANLGFLSMYVLGYFLPWRLTTIPGSIIPLLTLSCAYLIPETPLWLLKNKRRAEAEANLCLLRGLPVEAVQEEMAELETVLQGEATKTGEAGMEPGGCGSYKKLFQRSALLPMALLVYLFTIQSFSGSNMVSYYTVTILQMADIPIDENIAAIFVAGQYFLGYAITSYIVTRVPRRVMLFGSLMLMGLANSAAGIVLLRNQPQDTKNMTSSHIALDPAGFNSTHFFIGEPDQLIPEQIMSADRLPPGSPATPTAMEHWASLIPVVCCVLITLSYGLGLGPVPWILFGELFPSSVRGKALSITAVLRSVTVFISIKIFPNLLDLCGIGGSFLTCALVCFSAIGVCYLTVPETKGLNSAELEMIYRREKTCSISAEVETDTSSCSSSSE